MYKYNIQFIAGVENNYSYFPCLILLIKKCLAKCITKKYLYRRPVLLAFESHFHYAINNTF